MTNISNALYIPLTEIDMTNNNNALHVTNNTLASQ